MKPRQITSLFFALALATAQFQVAFADDHDHDHDREHHEFVRHEEWKKGYHMHKEDWERGARVDYHEHHLRAPPRGYEWREVDGNYVLAAVATGVIASVVAASIAGR
jgi:Ni/Co efflux regulator RcnB